MSPYLKRVPGEERRLNTNVVGRHRLRVVNFAYIPEAGVYFPVDVESEHADLSKPDKVRITEMTRIVVTDFKVNSRVDTDHLGFSFKEGSVVQFLGLYDGRTPSKWAIWGNAGKPERIFDSRSDLDELEWQKKHGQLFWVVVLNAVAIAVIYVLYRALKKRK